MELRNNCNIILQTAGAKLNLLDNITKYNWSPDYMLNREKIVKGMTVEKIQSHSKKYLDTNKMVWLGVDDAKTQLEHDHSCIFEKSL